MPLLEMYTHGITFHTSRADSRRYLPDVIDLVAHDRFDPLQVPTTIAAWQDAPEAWLRPATKFGYPGNGTWCSPGNGTQAA